MEIPWIPPGSLADYRATLARLAPLVEAAEVVVPGHGAAAATATRRCACSTRTCAYLDALERGDERLTLPEGRDTKAQRKIHAENLTRV